MRKVLIANRGEIARRITRTCREMGIATVAVFSGPDADAPFVSEADEAVALGGASPAESYLAADLLIGAATRTGADAVHPGYGFLAENAEFARRCAEAGLSFIGPPPDVIAAMGSKLEAKRRMAEAGVPLLPSREISRSDATECDQAISEIGLPLLVKASAGGGGKGMRVVRNADDLAEAVVSARRESQAAFGDGTLYLERYLEGARHVEVQIFGDQHGNIVHLGERECSIQRRHQKIVEESPCTALTSLARDAICDAAVVGGRAIGYVGAGTVEFLLAADGKFYFLEVNTRLQVEHAVTEMTMGLDLVRWQIEVARGRRLPKADELPSARGHAIEVRLYAEDASQGYLPQIGTLHRFEIAADQGVRVDSGVESGSVVSVHYDPMLAKVIAWAPTREECAAKLAAALASARIHGVKTNRALLVGILRDREFIEGCTDTGFLERNSPEVLSSPRPQSRRVHEEAMVAALALQARARSTARVLAFAPSGWRNVHSQDQRRRFESARGSHEVAYRLGENSCHAVVDGVVIDGVRIHACSDTAVDIEIAGLRRKYLVDVHDAVIYLDGPDGDSELRSVPRFAEDIAESAAGSLAAPMPGKVVDVRVEVDMTVEAGTVLVVLEAMKMEQKVVAPERGRVVMIRAALGDQVEAGQVLAVVEPITAES